MAAITQVRILVTANYFEVFHLDLIICVGATLFSCIIMIIDITKIIEKQLKGALDKYNIYLLYLVL